MSKEASTGTTKYQESIMLQLRPICENCALALPPDSTDARICSFECTFCARCVDEVLFNVCPNCGGGFVERPIRPVSDWRNENHVGKYPPTGKRIHKPVDVGAHAAFAAAIKKIPPGKR